jgi:hypothetical protein
MAVNLVIYTSSALSGILLQYAGARARKTTEFEGKGPL